MSARIVCHCEVCGNEFDTPPSRAARGGGRYCSAGCRNRGKRPGRTERAADPKRIAARFWPHVDKDGPTLVAELGACWVWTASRNHKGYGRLRCMGKAMLAHRVAFFLEHGRWPEPCALHKCDGGSIGCVRQEHLREGDMDQNNAEMDARERRRGGSLPGTTNRNSRLTEQAVLEMRRAREAGATLQRLAQRFGVDQSTVSDIVRRNTWKHVS